jgi:hypothetical protein
MSDDKHEFYPTPATHQPPKLVDLPSDDPAVYALTLPPPLAPVDDDETPPPIANPNDPIVLERKEQLREFYNAQLAAAAPAKSQEQRIADLELKVLNQGNQIENLRDMFKIYLYGKSL